MIAADRCVGTKALARLQRQRRGVFECQRCDKNLRRQRPSDPEAQAVGLDKGGAPAPAGGAEVGRVVVPAAAAEDAGRTIAAHSPRRAVGR